MRSEHYSSVQEMVNVRATSQFDHMVGVDLKPVTVRLTGKEIDELDLLAGYLGFSSRQQFMSQLISSGINDALQALTEALSGDSEALERFTEERLQILSEHSGEHV